MAHPRTIRIAALGSVGALALIGGALAQHEHGHAAFCDPEAVTPEPVLDVGDFDGDGTVSEEDVRRIERRVEAGEYIAFFDRNADHALDRKDVAITAAEVGAPSGRLDQQLAAAFQGTQAYMDREAAIADGFIPFTERFYGHGAHWAQHPENAVSDYAFEPGEPEGLNYDQDGRLWGVFYYVGESPTRADGTKYPPGHEFRPEAEVPEGFAGDADVWHHHAGACLGGINYADPVMDPSKLSFREGLSPEQCLPEAEDGGFDLRNTKWTAKFYMIHAWLYELNPCGTFAGAHPRLAEGATHPATNAPHGRIDPASPHPDYPFEGGTLCHWLGQIGREPDDCADRRAPP